MSSINHPFLLHLNSPYNFRANNNNKTQIISRKSRIHCTNSKNSPNQQQQQLNLSVLRFTLGIPGLDESNLPRWIGYAFGSLIFVNHFLGSDANTITPAQLRTEALGLCLAAFSVFVPFLGKFLKGSSPVDQATLPEGSEQLFIMSQNISDTIKEDLAWGTYILLRNTNTVSVLISAEDALCVRGYWNAPKGIAKDNAVDWFEKQVQLFGLSNLKDTLYFPQSTDSNLWKILPKETRSILVHPILLNEKSKGFILLASSISYAYNNRDRAWIGAIANKYRG